jgi:hypothetical protein
MAKFRILGTLFSCLGNCVNLKNIHLKSHSRREIKYSSMHFLYNHWNSFQNFTSTKKTFAESSHYATDSTESSLSSTASTTSTGTVVCNLNALKPKNNQTHSVSQMSLQSTGITTAAFAKQSSPTVDKSNKCHLVQCSFKESGQKDHPIAKTTSSITKNHGTIMVFRNKRKSGESDLRCGFVVLTM